MYNYTILRNLSFLLLKSVPALMHMPLSKAQAYIASSIV